jgi:hypothetical protein
MNSKNPASAFKSPKLAQPSPTTSLPQNTLSISKRPARPHQQTLDVTASASLATFPRWNSPGLEHLWDDPRCVSCRNKNFLLHIFVSHSHSENLNQTFFATISSYIINYSSHRANNLKYRHRIKKESA